jgi:hypothetical protein
MPVPKELIVYWNLIQSDIAYNSQSYVSVCVCMYVYIGWYRVLSMNHVNETYETLLETTVLLQ